MDQRRILVPTELFPSRLVDDWINVPINPRSRPRPRIRLSINHRYRQHVHVQYFPQNLGCLYFDIQSLWFLLVDVPIRLDLLRVNSDNFRLAKGRLLVPPDSLYSSNSSNNWNSSDFHCADGRRLLLDNVQGRNPIQIFEIAKVSFIGSKKSGTKQKMPLGLQKPSLRWLMKRKLPLW